MVVVAEWSSPLEEYDGLTPLLLLKTALDVPPAVDDETEDEGSRADVVEVEEV